MSARGKIRAARSWLSGRQGLVAATLVTAVFFGNQGFRRLAGHWLELRRLKKEIILLREQKAQVDGELKLLRTSRAPLERMARKDLGFIKPGEIEYRFPPPR